MKTTGIYILLLSLLLSAAVCGAQAQEVRRPPLYGIAKMTFRISSFELAKKYYGDFLGFDRAFSYPSGQGAVESYKINDRQFLEFVEDGEAPRKNRLVSISFETDGVRQMKDYLVSKGIVPSKDVYTDGAGNKVMLVIDPSGVPVEFIEYGRQSLHVLSRAKYLPERRIATRLHHAGLYCRQMQDSPAFYTAILQFQRVLRFPPQPEQGEPKILYFRIPESAEMIEHYPTGDENFNHPCFVTQDMQETFSILRDRRTAEALPPPAIGLGKRWLLNLWNADGTKVEFTEPYISVF
jgi:catechol 2,3-dioxygenase-like lactoylglutathione lyase family enzyme